MAKRIGVIGVGAIGGSIGGFLSAAGEDITLIDPWKEHVESMRDDGLLLDGSVGEQRVRVHAITTDELDQIDEKFDVLVVAVKSYNTVWATQLMMPYIHDDTWVVTPQNGINEFQIAPIVGSRRTIGCVTTISAGMYGPAHVTRTQGTGRSAAQLGSDPIAFKIGEMDGRTSSRVEELAEIFQPAGRTVVTDNLWGERWSKLATNSMVNPTSAMMGLGGYDLRAHDGARNLIFNLGIESVSVGRLLGYNVAVPIGGYEIEDLRRAVAEGHPSLEQEYIGKPATIPGMPSMAQDVKKGRRTEVEFLNGVVADFGKRIGYPTPFNEAAVTVLKGVESGEFEVGLENIRRLESIVATTR